MEGITTVVEPKEINAANVLFEPTMYTTARPYDHIDDTTMQTN
jgi:hypothetical protein